MLGGRFRLEDPPIHRGLHADVFGATDVSAGTSQEANDHPVVHVLRREGASEEQVRNWFENRVDCWHRIEHPQVLKVHEWSDPVGKKGLPFFHTDRVMNSRSLEQFLQSGEALSDETSMEALVLAAEVCRVAHQQEILILAFPAHHFLMDINKNLYLTGFESAIFAQFGTEFPASLQYYLRRFSRHLDLMMAPELKRDNGIFQKTLDVFAIGALMARLRSLHLRPMDAMPLAAWADPWQCVAFHCLEPTRTCAFNLLTRFWSF